MKINGHILPILQMDDWSNSTAGVPTLSWETTGCNNNSNLTCTEQIINVWEH